MTTIKAPQVSNGKETLPAASNDKINNNNNNNDKSNDEEDKGKHPTAAATKRRRQEPPPLSAAATTKLLQDKFPQFPSLMSITNNISHCCQRRRAHNLPFPLLCSSPMLNARQHRKHPLTSKGRDPLNPNFSLCPRFATASMGLLTHSTILLF